MPWPIPGSLPAAASPEVIAPLFLWGGRVLVFPTIRVLVRWRFKTDRRFEFFSLDEWLAAALSIWPMPRWIEKHGSKSSAALEEAREFYKEHGLPTVAGQLKRARNCLNAKAKLHSRR